MMNAHVTPDQRLATILGDIMWACIWATVLCIAVAFVNFGVYWLMRWCCPNFMPGLMGMDESGVAIIWMAALALVKLTAFSFAVTAFALWVWRARLIQRLEG